MDKVEKMIDSKMSEADDSKYGKWAIHYDGLGYRGFADGLKGMGLHCAILKDLRDGTLSLFVSDKSLNYDQVRRAFGTTEDRHEVVLL